MYTHTLPSLAIVLPVLVLLLAGNAKAATCNVTTPCPSQVPCCSEYGFCGTDSFCLGGCNPLASHTLNSCKPNPVCHNAVHTFANNSRILSNATYFNGNASEYDWVLNNGNIFNTNSSGGELVLTLTEANGGTRLSSTRYIHYGTITATIKTGHWAGVVTAFITMSDIKDEIDWEFPGANVTQGQTNYFWQGYIPVSGNNGEVENGINDSSALYHDYTIDWQPQSLTFLIDGKVVRTISASRTVDPSGVTRYPNTPSRVQLSIWPAGISSQPSGTVQWAGGLINWKDPDYVTAGHFYALVKKVTVKCADPQVPGHDITAYVYGKNTTLEAPSTFFTNETTLLDKAYHTFGSTNLQVHGILIVAVGLLAPYLL